MSLSLVLGIDVGTTSAKCLAVDETGRPAGFGQQGYALSHPHPGWVEQDPEELWRGLVTAVTACLQDCRRQGGKPAAVRALALSTQADTLIPVDDSGRPLRAALSWMDGRARAEHAGLLAETGPEFWPRETGMPLSPVSSACKLRWLQRHERLSPARWCYVPDWLTWRLCGRFAADAPSISWSPFYSPTRRRWIDQVLRLAGVTPEQLPEVVDAGRPLGELLPAVAAELGLPAGTVVVAGAFDQVAAAHGAGARPGQVGVLSCGTAWVLYLAVDQPPATDVLLPACCHVGEEQWGLVLPFAGGSVYDWYRQAFAHPAQVVPGGASLVFIPHLYGGLAPDWREESRGSLLGLTLDHTWEDVRHAVRLGICCEARRNLEAAGRLPLLRMVGGAAADPAWVQLTADLLGLPVSVPELTEAACYGAAMLAAGKQSACWSMGEGRRHEPDPTQAQALEQDYRRHLAAYQALLPIYKDW